MSDFKNVLVQMNGSFENHHEINKQLVQQEMLSHFGEMEERIDKRAQEVRKVENA
jgi:hypothetical protein